MAKEKTEKKWFEKSKGFGFLESGGNDFFVHYKYIDPNFSGLIGNSANDSDLVLQEKIAVLEKCVLFYYSCKMKTRY